MTVAQQRQQQDPQQTRLIPHPARIELHQRGWSMADFAAYLGVHRNYASAVLSGSRPLTRPFAERVAAALDMPVEEAFHPKEIEEIEPSFGEAER